MTAVPIDEIAPVVRLGLIGANIRQSRSPDLHRICGELTGLNIQYDLLIPAERGQEFDDVLAACAGSGMRGVNVTYPYKERAVGKVNVLDRRAADVGSINTIVFAPSGAVGYNTDYTGFIAAYREAFGDRPPGSVAIIGAGGVGRAIAFALAELGASELRLADTVAAKASALMAALGATANRRIGISASGSVVDAVTGADGIVNATPIGMAGYDGSAVPARSLGRQRWAFDAVYTPVETEFKRQAEAAGVAFLSGYALFFHQGLDAFHLFTGRRPANPGAIHDKLRNLVPS